MELTSVYIRIHLKVTEKVNEKCVLIVSRDEIGELFHLFTQQLIVVYSDLCSPETLNWNPRSIYPAVQATMITTTNFQYEQNGNTNEQTWKWLHLITWKQRLHSVQPLSSRSSSIKFQQHVLINSFFSLWFLFLCLISCVFHSLLILIACIILLFGICNYSVCTVSMLNVQIVE